MADDAPKPLVEYPTVYAFKVMAKREPDFADWVRALFERVLGFEVAQDAIRENVSKQGAYVSLTVSVPLENEAQRQAVYAAIHTEKRIVYYL